MKKIIFHDWQIIDFKTAWEKQESILGNTHHRKFIEKQPTENHFVFCEHPHVFTIGKSGNNNNLLVDEKFLTKIQATVFHINRGGDITYHGPGQIVGYPIIDLENFGLGVKKYIEQLEEVIIRTLAEYNIKATRLKGATGVWLDAHNKNVRKICAIGVRVSRGVTMHGFAFNINTNLKYFSYINPCGFTDKGVTSLQKELGRNVDMAKVKSKIKKHFQDIFLTNNQ
ncbi:MAG: lipoate--protein ligase [Candidatus Zixiibacteriota bacterium]|nr:MAG: lipoate--protein ligase [candidate division Zixibacteria bacterium]